MIFSFEIQLKKFKTLNKVIKNDLQKLQKEN